MVVVTQIVGSIVNINCIAVSAEWKKKLEEDYVP
jgi:hypothetical protein